MGDPQFVPFETLYEKENRSIQAGRRWKSFADYYNSYGPSIRSQRGTISEKKWMRSRVVSVMEYDWFKDRRPFYRVWGTVIPGFLRASLEVPTAAIALPSKVMSVEVQSGCIRTQSMLVMKAEWGDDRRIFVAMQNSGGKFGEMVIYFPIEDGVSVEETLAAIARENQDLPEEQHRLLYQQIEQAFRVVICVSLIAKDPKFAESICLAKDRPKRTAENADQLQAKAIKRGVHGWDIGRSIEVGPHVRRPHFAIRWCGTKAEGLEPRLVPVKASVVHRSRITDVPTGWHGDLSPQATEQE